MKNILIIVLSLVLSQSYAQQNLLQEGGTKVNVTAVTKAGTFKTTGSAKGLSTEGDSLMLHAAGYTTPGGISLLDQFLGKGTKYLSKPLNGVSTALVLYNDSAADGDLGEGIGMDFLGGGETPMASLYATQNDVTGSSLNVNVRNSVGTTTMVKYDGEQKLTTHTGLQTVENITVVSGILDGSLYVNKASSYNLLSGATLLLEQPSTKPDGTFVNFTATNVTGSNCAINTTSGVNEFWNNGSATSSPDVIITTGSVKTGKAEVHTVGGTKYWVITIF